MRKAIMIILTVLLSSGAAVEISAAANDRTTNSITEAELQLVLRDLWTGHVFWVRSVVVASHYDDAGNAEAGEAKAVENARAIADAIIPFYGADAADQLFELLAGHYGAIKDYMQAGFADSAAGKDAAAKKIVANAEEIAIFLDGANPHLPKQAVLPLLMAHGGHHMQQIDALHNQDFAAEAEVWDSMLSHMYTIADAMAGALAKQFPQKVSG